MNITNRLFTYPVLSDEKDDYKGSFFKVDYKQMMQGDVPALNLEGNISAEEEDIDYSDDENTDAVDTSDVSEVTLGCKIVIRNIDKEIKTYKYDMVNGILPKAVEVFAGCKVGDIVEMMGKEWRIEDVIF